MSRFLDREPTGFCIILNRVRVGFDFTKNSTGSNLDIQIALITAVQRLMRVFRIKIIKISDPFKTSVISLRGFKKFEIIQLLTFYQMAEVFCKVAKVV